MLSNSIQLRLGEPQLCVKPYATRMTSQGWGTTFLCQWSNLRLHESNILVTNHQYTKVQLFSAEQLDGIVLGSTFDRIEGSSYTSNGEYWQAYTVVQGCGFITENVQAYHYWLGFLHGWRGQDIDLLMLPTWSLFTGENKKQVFYSITSTFTDLCEGAVISQNVTLQIS